MNAMLKIGDFVEASECSQLISVPLPQRWYLLRVQPGREGKVTEAFARRMISFYLPVVTKRVGIGRILSSGARQRYENRSVPMFPGLVFIPDFDADIDRLREIEGVSGFLKFGSQAAHAGPSIMQEVRQCAEMAALPLSKRKRLMHVGDYVRIKTGHFAMWIGKIDRLAGSGRIRVLIEALKREMPILVSEHQVEPANPRPWRRRGSTEGTALRRKRL